MYNPQTLTKKVIDQIFEEAEQQSDYVLALYKIAYPSLWDMIAKVNGWPRVSKATHEYLFQKAIEFDIVHHPNVVAGGAWLNSGFGLEGEMKDWFVVPCDTTLVS